MKNVIIALSIFLFTSCGCVWETTVKDITTNTILDSLPQYQRTELRLGKVEKRVYQDTVPAASCPGMIYKFTVYNLADTVNGVYEMDLTYIEAENGEDKLFKSSGRWSKICGMPNDSTATIYRFVEFEKGGDTLNLQYNEKSLTLLNSTLEPSNSTLNYTLPLVSKPE